MKRFINFLFMFFLTITSVFANIESNVLPSQLGKVLSVDFIESEDSFVQAKQLVTVKLLEGEFKNDLIVLDNILTGNPYYDIKLREGMNVVLHVEEDGNEVIYTIENIHRSNVLVCLALIFATLLCIVGRKKGLYSIISILITGVLIFTVLTPLILWGINPILATILLCIMSSAITMYLVGGFNKKSSSALLGTILSLIFAGCISYITVKVAHLNGICDEHSMFLYTAHPELDFVSITISAIILATLGAVMDVGMSIASTINEIYSIDNNKTFKELFISGMNVGKDIIGTMANTLILVYFGTTLPLILLASNIDIQKFINLNQVVTEISSALIGSIAIVICVPITAFVASKFVIKRDNKIDFSNLIE